MRLGYMQWTKAGGSARIVYRRPAWMQYSCELYSPVYAVMDYQVYPSTREVVIRLAEQDALWLPTTLANTPIECKTVS